MKSCEIFIEGIGGARIVEKLLQGGVPVLAARAQKRGVLVRVDTKDREKVFAILRGSCYNGKKVRPRGAARAIQALVRHAGLLAGVLFFSAAVLFGQSRVLRIEVVGSGAYYAAEVERLLAREGTGFFSPPPADRARITAQILAFPRVSFCSLSHEGGVLTVCVEVEDEAQAPAGGSLFAPVSGTVAALTVLSGTARVEVGAFVREGDILVENVTSLAGESFPATVIASAAVRYAVDDVFEGSRGQALAAAYLAHGGLEGVTIQKTGDGWRVTGQALAYAALNLG